MKKFFRSIIIIAFGLFAGFASGIGTPTLLSMIGLSNEFEGLGIIVGLLVLASCANGLQDFLEDVDKKMEKKR